MEAPRVTPPCLHLTACPNCGYSLSGMPDNGICPECGRIYDRSEIVLHGWGRGTHESVFTAGRSRVVWVAFLSAITFFFQWCGLAVHPETGAYLLLSLAAVPASIWLYAWFRRTEGHHLGQIQVRLGEAGCVQFDNLSGHNIFRHFLRASAPWVALAIVAGLVASYHFGAIDRFLFWLWLPIAVVACFVAWLHARKLGRELAKIREGSIADLEATYNQVTPWKKIRSPIRLHSTKVGRYRLQLENMAKWLTTHPVDAEILCTPEQGEALMVYISGRISHARRIDVSALLAAEA